jgi:hypothetical protein
MSKRERDPERDGGLGRFKSEASRARALGNLRPVRNSEDAIRLGMSSGVVRHEQAIIRMELRKQLQRKVPGDREHRSYLEKIVGTLLQQACKGDVSALRLIAERCDGLISEDQTFQPERILVVVNRNVRRFEDMPKQAALPPEAS